jgi:hypothetical protein
VDRVKSSFFGMVKMIYMDRIFGLGYCGDNYFILI